MNSRIGAQHPVSISPTDDSQVCSSLRITVLIDKLSIYDPKSYSWAHVDDTLQTDLYLLPHTDLRSGHIKSLSSNMYSHLTSPYLQLYSRSSLCFKFHSPTYFLVSSLSFLKNLLKYHSCDAICKSW